jgi:triphosphoribosyl-dephospho-CoA synthase
MNIESLLALPIDELASLQLSRSDSTGTFVASACLLEATSVKAGNVHPSSNFDNMDYGHFRLSAAVTGQAIDALSSDNTAEPLEAPSVGNCIYEMTLATKQHVGVNTNLGTLILIGPLVVAAKLLGSTASTQVELQLSLSQVLGSLNETDSRAVYESIRLANPGGLGTSPKMDAHQEAPRSILDAMILASPKDDVAKQWVSNYQDVFSLAKRIQSLRNDKDFSRRNWLEAISIAQIEYLASHVDSLIVRKNNFQLAVEIKRRAEHLVSIRATGSSEGSFDESNYQSQWNELDEFLREDGNRRNPGTTADLLAAATFVALICEAN